MMVKNTWLSRLLVRLNDKTWVVWLWIMISPFLILGPMRIVKEKKLRSNAAVLTARVVEYVPNKPQKVKYVYQFDGKYYVNTNRIYGKQSYTINEPITIIVNKDNPQQSHLWDGRKPN